MLRLGSAGAPAEGLRVTCARSSARLASTFGREAASNWKPACTIIGLGIAIALGCVVRGSEFDVAGTGREGVLGFGTGVVDFVRSDAAPFASAAGVGVGLRGAAVTFV